MSIFAKLKDNKIFKAGAGYTIGNYLLKGLGFITVPLFSRIMEPSDFGIYNTFLSYEGILYLFVGLALHSSIKNALYKYGTEHIDEYTSSILIIPFINAILFFVFGNIALPAIQNVLYIDRIQLNLLILFCWGTSILYMYQSRLVLEYKARSYMGLSYFNVIASVVLTIIFVLFVYQKQKYLGRIIGTVLPMVVLGVWITIKLAKKAKPVVNKEYYKYGLKISLPIIPHGIGQVLLSSSDRIMITNMVGTTESGLYSFAHTIYSIILVTGNSISTVLEPWAYSKLAEKDGKAIQDKATDFILGLATICAGAMLVSPELVYILGSKKYADSIPLVTPVVFSGFFAMAYTMPSIIEYYKEKTTYIAYGTGIVATLNIILNFLLIPRLGYVATAYTTLVSYFVYYVFHSYIAFKLVGYNVVPIKVSIVASVSLLGVAIITLSNINQIWVRFLTAIIVVLFAVFYIYKKYIKK